MERKRRSRGGRAKLMGGRHGEEEVEGRFGFIQARYRLQGRSYGIRVALIRGCWTGLTSDVLMR